MPARPAPTTTDPRFGSGRSHSNCFGNSSASGTSLAQCSSRRMSGVGRESGLWAIEYRHVHRRRGHRRSPSQAVVLRLGCAAAFAPPNDWGDWGDHHHPHCCSQNQTTFSPAPDRIPRRRGIAPGRVDCRGAKRTPGSRRRRRSSFWNERTPQESDRAQLGSSFRYRSATSWRSGDEFPNHRPAGRRLCRSVRALRRRTCSARGGAAER